MKFPCFAVLLSTRSMRSTLFKSTQCSLCEVLGSTHFIPFHLSPAMPLSLSLSHSPEYILEWFRINNVLKKIASHYIYLCVYTQNKAFIHITLEDLVKIQTKTLFSIYVDGVIWLVMVENIL